MLKKMDWNLKAVYVFTAVLFVLLIVGFISPKVDLKTNVVKEINIDDIIKVTAAECTNLNQRIKVMDVEFVNNYFLEKQVQKPYYQACLVDDKGVGAKFFVGTELQLEAKRFVQRMNGEVFDVPAKGSVKGALYIYAQCDYAYAKGGPESQPVAVPSAQPTAAEKTSERLSNYDKLIVFSSEYPESGCEMISPEQLEKAITVPLVK